MIFLQVVIFLLALACLASIIVALTGESKWDRLLGYGLISAKINMMIVILAYVTGNTFYLDIALVYIVLSYIGIVSLADYFNARGGPDRV